MPTYSVEQELGNPCPSFSLPSVDGQTYSLESFSKSQALMVAFICGHCPYVQKIEDKLIALAKHYLADQFQMLGVCSNDPTDYPEDAPEKLLKRWRDKHYGFPYLLDETQDVARAFDAVCTPDLYVFDKNRRLFYHGHLDGVDSAVQLILTGGKSPLPQQPSMGCSIKWKKY